MSKIMKILALGIRRPWDRSILVTALCVFASGVLFSTYLSRDRVNSNADLRLVTGRLANYSFLEGFRGSHKYYLYLEGYSPRFQIRADDLDLFSKYGFTRSVKNGDEITLGISNESFKKNLYSSDRVHLFSIQKGPEIFLRSDGAIQSNNSPAPIIFGSIFLVAAMSIVVARGFGMEVR